MAPVDSMDGSCLALGRSDPSPAYYFHLATGVTTSCLTSSRSIVSGGHRGLQSRMDAQMARVRMMSKHFLIPVSNFE
jgi:hypothetical protein